VGDCQTPPPGNPGSCDSYTVGSLTGVAALHAAAAAYIDTVIVPPVRLDNVPVRNLTAYRFSSPEFSYSLTTDNVLNFLGIPDPAGTYTPAVSDGYWLMFKPLSPGLHTITSGDLTIILTVK
jgi:hypothetical protein